jgi:hypothetical protein
LSFVSFESLGGRALCFAHSYDSLAHSLVFLTSPHLTSLYDRKLFSLHQQPLRAPTANCEHLFRTPRICATTTSLHLPLFARSSSQHHLKALTEPHLLHFTNMSAFESAIYDSFDPPQQPIEDEETDDESFFDNAYNGPRDGRWEVASSVGSFVDDRCPTVYGYRPQSRPAGRETRIDDGLVKKLMQATIEHKRAEAAALTRQTATVGGVPTDNGKAPSAPPSMKVSRPFFVPPLRNNPYSAVVASRKVDQEHVQKAPSAHQLTKANNDFPATATREAATPKAATAKAQSDIPQRTTPDRSTVRILGKNGEEAFISLPSLAKSVQALSHMTQQRSGVAVPVSESHVSAGNFQPDEMVAVPGWIEPKEQDQNHNQEQNKRQKNKQKNNKQKKPQDRVEQLITESPQVEEVGSQRAASWVMSGALPAPSREPSREPSQAPQSAANSMRDSGIAMSDFITSVKAGSSRASSVRPSSAISPGVLSIAQYIAKRSSTTSSARNSKPKSVEGFKEMGLGMTTGYPTQERTSDRSNHGRAKQVSSSRHSSQPTIRRESGSVRSEHTAQQSLPSRHGSQRSFAREPGSVQQQDEGDRQEAMQSNYKPPTVVSASSSASITHSFSGFYPEGFVPQDQPTLLRQEDGIGSRNGGSEKSRSVRSGSSRSSVKDASDKASSKHSQPSSHGHRSHQPISIRSDRGSSVHSGANYVSDVKQSRSGLQAHRSDHSRSTRSDRAGSVQSVASHASVASSRPKKAAFQATSMSPHPRSERLSQASGTRCPSHSPVSPLAPSPQLFTLGQERTNFAGDGWISPWPGSVIPSHKSAVSVPADGPGHCVTLTYSEWEAQRENLESEAGSYAGSRVPSAVGLQDLPREVYSHPPPAGYVGSYNPDARYSPQPVPQMDGEPAWISQHFSPLQGANAVQPPASVHSQQGSLLSYSSAHSQQDPLREQNSTHSQQGSLRSRNSAHSQKRSLRGHSSAHSQSGSPTTAHNNSLYNQPVDQTPIAVAQNAGWSFPPQDDRPSSNHTPAYNVGLTPAELSTYQSQLGSTISRYASRISHVQREQTPPQPDYDVWNSGRSHHSSRRSSSQHSVHNFPPNPSYPRVKSQLAMPWDATVSQVNTRFTVPARQGSSHGGSSWRGSVGGVSGVESRLHSNAGSSRGSVGSRSSVGLADSQVTYGSAEWEKLENAEDGRGGFQVPEGYNMW